MTYTHEKRYPTGATTVRLLLSLVAVCAWVRPAWALQPLSAFLSAADASNFDIQQVEQLALQRGQEAKAASGRLMPSLAVMGAYTRNQYSASLPVGTRLLKIAPYDQLDASATLTVPVFDVTAWARRTATRAQHSSAKAQRLSGQLAAAKQIAARYYTLRSNENILSSAKSSMEFTERNLALVRNRQEAGTASSLDLARAESDKAEAEKQVAQAQLQVELTRRALLTLTGLEAEPSDGFDEVSLEEEAPLATWLQAVNPSLPAMADAYAQQKMAQAGDRAAKFGYLPTLSVSASERLTNASALNGGHTFVWTAKANLAWTLDATLTPTQKAQAHVARGARVRTAQMQRQIEDAIYNDWAQIKANQATSRAARAQVRTTQLAETLALEKVAAGIITQLDVTQARRDAFAAVVSRIQADANLLYYRTLLRLDSATSVAAFEEPKQ